MNFKGQRLAGRSLKRIEVRNETPLQGEIVPPPDKSISHRAIVITSLSEGTSVIRNFLRSEDPLRTLEAFRAMGIDIEDENNEIFVHGKGLNGLKEPGHTIDCGNSGTTMRILSGVLAGQRFTTQLTGDDSLRNRPMKRVIDPLKEMGALITAESGGYPPLMVKGGPLKPISFRSPVASAQVKSAVLLAGLYCEGVTRVTEPAKSRDHTERMLKAAGASVNIDGLEVSVHGDAYLKPLEFSVPGDFSSAAFFMVAAVLVPGSEVLIRNTGINPTRTGLLEILRKMGAQIVIENVRKISGEPVADISVRNSELKGIDIGGDLILEAIDEFPVLCVAAARAQGLTRISGAGELRVKESDRITAMVTELRKMGAEIEELHDGLIITGKDSLGPAVVQSYGDHRVAMALLVAGLLSGGVTRVENTECMNTSFPGFMELLAALRT